MSLTESHFGVSTLLYRELPLTRALELIGGGRFKKIDLAIIPPSYCPHYDPIGTARDDDQRLKALIDRFGLTVSSINAVPGYFNRDEPAEVSEFIRRCVDIAHILNTKIVTIPSGVKVPDREWLASARRVKKHLTEDSSYAADQDVTISLETPHVGTLAETLEQTRELHDLINCDRIKCTLDTSHAIRSSGKRMAAGVVAVGIDRIDHIHLRDAIGDEIGFTPGKGRGDFIGFFEAVKSHSYAGDFIFELEFEDLPEKLKIKELDFAADYILNICASGKIPGRLALQANPAYQLLSRFMYDPKREIKRHGRLFKFLKMFKPVVMKLMPEKVHEGKWVRKYRFRKTAVVNHRPHSIKLKTSGRIYQIGIVGCGWAGREMHGPGFERLDNTRIVGVYDIDRERAGHCAARFGCTAYGSLAELVDGGKPDIVAVCSREWAHYEAARYLLNSGVDVFCEKIMATRFRDARAMVDAARKNNRVLAVNYNYRMMPGIRKLKEVIEQKAMGELVFFNMNVHGMSYHHALDLLSFLGGEIVTVSGSYRNDDRIRTFGNTDWSLYDPDILYVPSINASVTCEFRGGAVGVVNSSYYYPLHSFVLSVEAVFEHGCLALSGLNMFDVVGKLTYFSTHSIKKVDMNHRKGVFARSYEYTFYMSIESFMRRYSRNIIPETPGQQGLVNIILEKAISRSNETKAKVNFPEFYKECMEI